MDNTLVINAEQFVSYFQLQTDVTEPITEDILETLKNNRRNFGITEEAIEKELGSVVPNVTKQFYYMLRDCSNTDNLNIFKILDCNLASTFNSYSNEGNKLEFERYSGAAPMFAVV